MKECDTSDEFSTEHPIVARKIKKSLELSIKEGSASSLSVGFGATYFAPFVLALGATSSQMGLLHAFATFFPGIAQLFATKRLGKESRKHTLIFSKMLTLLIWLPIILSGYLFLHGFNVVWLVIILIGIYYVAGGFGHIAWFSWMGSIVPANHRGHYFSRRTRATTMWGIIAMILSAMALDFSKRFGGLAEETTIYTILTFTLLFVLGMFFTTRSIMLLKKQYEPYLVVRKKDQMGFWTFLKNAPRTAFGKFTLFNFVLRISVAIASPFFVVYMLRNLGLSYIVYILIVVAGLVFQMIFLRVHGKMSDRFGNVSLAKLSVLFISLTPIVWVLSVFIPTHLFQVIYLIFFAQMIDGFGWAGYNLAVSNYVYDSVGGARRGYVLSYMNVLVGIGAFIGASIGSWLAIYQPKTLSIILVIFLISFVCRLATLFFMGKHLEEVRKVKKFDPNFLMHEIDPVRRTINEVHHLQHLGDRVIHHI